VHRYAPVRGHELLRRRDLLPDEPDHPRADQAYYAMQLGPLERLELPIISLRWRRITFIETTRDRFQMAQEINELYASGADGLFVTLKDLGLAPEREYPVRESGREYVVDLAIPCRDGTLTVVLGDRPGPRETLRFASASEPTDDVDALMQAVERLGGVQT
jgi:hypothetical protein